MSIKKLLIYCNLFLVSITCYSLAIERKNIFTLMISPAGDAKNTGRKIEDSLERGISMQYAQALKELLEERTSDISIILTRRPGEIIQPLQNANFANRLDVDLFMSIHFFYDESIKPTIYLYQFSYNDVFIHRSSNFEFVPFDQAHLINCSQTTTFATTIKNTLRQDDYEKLFDTKGIFQLPLNPLIGIKTPALAVEMSVKHKTDWHVFLEPLVNSIASIIQQHRVRQ